MVNFQKVSLILIGSLQCAHAYTGGHVEQQRGNPSQIMDRRQMINNLSSSVAAAILTAGSTSTPALAEDASSMYSPKFVQEYPDFTVTDAGWSFKDVKKGNGDASPGVGDRAVFEWSGYTIGYFGRPFEAKGGPKGGAFDKDLDYDRTVIGSKTIIPALEEALMTMKPGGVRQVIVPYGALSYPESDKEHTAVGPKPTTFSGQRALNFVLDNPRVDRTLLFNLKLVRVDKNNGKGGFLRG